MDEETEVQRLRAELQGISAEAAKREAAARQQGAEVRGEAEQRQMQLAVIMETLGPCSPAQTVSRAPVTQSCCLSPAHALSARDVPCAPCICPPQQSQVLQG